MRDSARRSAIFLAGLSLVTFAALEASAKDEKGCQMVKIASPPITVTAGNRVLMDGSIGGEAGKFLVDTGATTTLIDNDVASHFKIQKRVIEGFGYGIGGRVDGFQGMIPDFKLGDYRAGDIPLWVMRTHFLDDGVYGVIGEDLFDNFDQDIDLKNNQFNLFIHHDCKTEPVYWAERFNEADLTIRDHNIFVFVEVNGIRARAILDTGATRTLVSWPLARRLGLSKDSPGMERVGTTSGVDVHPMDEYRFRFSEIKIGDEVVKNPTLSVMDLFHREFDHSLGYRIQDSNWTEADLLIGTDFIKSHHIYIAKNQGKMYFTWNGGGFIFSPPTENVPSINTN
jgi:predicted aspartyl protease